MQMQKLDDVTHRAYQPITPANNKLLKKRWDQYRYCIHRRKVTQAKGVIDNKPPETYMHLHLKLKKLQMEEERLATVERDNRILLEKMSTSCAQRGESTTGTLTTKSRSTRQRDSATY